MKTEKDNNIKIYSCEECTYYVRLDNEGCNFYGEILNSLEPCKNAIKKEKSNEYNR